MALGKKNFIALILSCIPLFSYSAKATSQNQSLIVSHQKSIFSAQEQNDCDKIIKHMALLTELTQNIPSTLYYFQGNCFFQKKQYSKSIPALESYFFNALITDKYYTQASKIYVRSEKYTPAIQAKKESIADPASPIKNIVQKIKTKTGIDFIKVEPSCFIMGSPLTESERADEEKQHKVCITQPFLLGKYEITQGQWEAITSKNPASFKQCGSRCPIENISWEDIQSFITILRIKTGFQFRLPTEAEWELAARAGSTTPFSFGSNINTSQVNYDGDHPYLGKGSGKDRKSPVAVGSLPANAWGFHEMHGNVWEFVQDWHTIDYYKNSPTNDPKGPPKGSFHVRRGGSWRFGARFCRSAFRGRFRPDSVSTLLGFRLALTLRREDL